MSEDTSNVDANAQPNSTGRRDFLQKAALGFGGISLGALASHSLEDQIAHATQKVNRNSKPSRLKITDLRMAVLEDVPFTSPIVRLETNQGIYGLGEVRDDADKRYALELKSRILGENPCNVERVFRIIEQFGGHGRQGGGVSGVEMALWDLAGKAYDVPVYQLLGGKYRDRIRLYTDTTSSEDPSEYAQRMKDKVENFGYTFLKMDVGISQIQDIPGALTGARSWGKLEQYNLDPPAGSYGSTKHPFTRVQITDKGLDEMAKYYAAMREAVGYEIPLGTDHTGHFDVNTAIRLAQRLEEYNLAYMEDSVAWFYTDKLKQITDSVAMPTMTGEDIYQLKGFKPLIDRKAVNLVHPDIATAGGILETKRIGDYAMREGIAMFIHYAGSPIGAMAAAHCAAATQNFVALEQHSAEVDFWDDLVTIAGVDKPFVKDGYYHVPEGPGLGVELNEEVAKQHLAKGGGYFEPTPRWNKTGSSTLDRQWS